MISKKTWILLFLPAVFSYCPPLDDSELGECEGMTDYQLCRVAITPNFEDLPEAHFGEPPLNCKIRAAAIREHILYWGTKSDTECRKASLLYSSCNNDRAEDACLLAGMSCTLTCKNGGILKDPKSDQCKCQCPVGYGGKECDECDMACMHGGQSYREGDTCWCTCPYPWGGARCDTCQRQCDHGGTLNSFWEPNPTGNHSTSCSCNCLKPWTGGDCEVCGTTCENGGVIDPDKCECVCPKCTRGPRCESCLRQCYNGGERIEENCTCSCPSPWTGPDCQECSRKCKNGGQLDKKSCTCDCDGAWSGPLCGKCDLKCYHRGRLDEKGCKCNCRAPWTGPSCRVCPISCLNGGQVDKQKCTCKCKPCKNGAVPDATCGCPKKATLVEQ